VTNSADRDWERMLERIDLDVSDAELAAAERQLQDLAPEEVAPVRAEWLAATVAKVRAEAAVQAAAAAAAAAPAPVPVHKFTLLRRLQRFAAAAAAVVGIHSVATAATVATVGVVAVTAVVLWEAGAFSNKTMPFRLALQIQLRPDQPEFARRAALSQITMRAKSIVESVQSVRDRSDSDPLLVGAAREFIAQLRAQLEGQRDEPIRDLRDTIDASTKILKDGRAPIEDRLARLEELRLLAGTCVQAMLTMPRSDGELELLRRNSLGLLGASARR
jgi:hypothetical protein